MEISRQKVRFIISGCILLVGTVGLVSHKATAQCSSGSCPASTGCGGFGYSEQDPCACPGNGGCCGDTYAVTSPVGSTCCAPPSPIVFDILGNGIDLTDAKAGVEFDFFGTGHKIQIA